MWARGNTAKASNWDILTATQEACSFLRLDYAQLGALTAQLQERAGELGVTNVAPFMTNARQRAFKQIMRQAIHEIASHAQNAKNPLAAYVDIATLGRQANDATSEDIRRIFPRASYPPDAQRAVQFLAIGIVSDAVGLTGSPRSLTANDKITLG